MIQKYVFPPLEKLAKPMAIFSLFLLAHLVLLCMMWFTFPLINEKLGTKAFDLQTFGYSFEQVIKMVENLDGATVRLYLFPQLFLLDILYPILLALFLSSAMMYLYNSARLNNVKILKGILLIPLSTLLLDYLENGFIAWMITHVDKITYQFVQISSLTTVLKSITTMISWTVLICLLVLWAIKYSRVLLFEKHRV